MCELLRLYYSRRAASPFILSVHGPGGFMVRVPVNVDCMGDVVELFPAGRMTLLLGGLCSYSLVVDGLVPCVFERGEDVSSLSLRLPGESA